MCGYVCSCVLGCTCLCVFECARELRCVFVRACRASILPVCVTAACTHRCGACHLRCPQTQSQINPEKVPQQQGLPACRPEAKGLALTGTPRGLRPWPGHPSFSPQPEWGSPFHAPPSQHLRRLLGGRPALPRRLPALPCPALTKSCPGPPLSSRAPFPFSLQSDTCAQASALRRHQGAAHSLWLAGPLTRDPATSARLWGFLPGPIPRPALPPTGLCGCNRTGSCPESS